MGSRELGLERDAEQAPIKTTAITVEPRTTIGSAHTVLAALSPSPQNRPAKLQANGTNAASEARYAKACAQLRWMAAGCLACLTCLVAILVRGAGESAPPPVTPSVSLIYLMHRKISALRFDLHAARAMQERMWRGRRACPRRSALRLAGGGGGPSRENAGMQGGSGTPDLTRRGNALSTVRDACAQTHATPACNAWYTAGTRGGASNCADRGTGCRPSSSRTLWRGLWTRRHFRRPPDQEGRALKSATRPRRRSKARCEQSLHTLRVHDICIFCPDIADTAW